MKFRMQFSIYRHDFYEVTTKSLNVEQKFQISRLQITNNEMYMRLESDKIKQ